MSQQAMHSDEMHEDGSASVYANDQAAHYHEEITSERPSTEYVEHAHANDFFIGSVGQKLSERDPRRKIVDQRLILAIASMVLLMAMSCVGIGLALITSSASATPVGDDEMFVHGYRHWHDFGSGDGMMQQQPGMYSHVPFHAHYWVTTPSVLPTFVLVYITFVLAVLAINLIFARGTRN